MGASHKYRPNRIKKHEDLHRGQPEDYPKLLAMHQEGYLNSEIGREFGVSGTTAGKLIRRYQAEAGL